RWLRRLRRQPRHLHRDPHRSDQGRHRARPGRRRYRRRFRRGDRSRRDPRQITRGLQGIGACRSTGGLGMKVLIIDNYDSFTYNLVQYLGELGAEIEVVRNDAETIDQLQARNPDRVVISPGPCTPNEAGVSLEAIKTFAEAGTP